MRPASDADAEYGVLTTGAGRDLLAEVAWVRRPSPSDVARWRRSHPIDRVSAAIRLVESRHRASAKFDRAEAMWLDPVGLEQATAEPVARHKAARFAGSVAFDLCSGIGGDALALAGEARGVVAVDLDEGMAHRARWNAEVYGVGHMLAPILGRAEGVAIPPEALVHIDPDRRVRAQLVAAGLVDDYVPGLDFLRKLPARCRGGAIKLGPASDFARAFGDLPVEIELVTHAGECKEATVWFGDLATPGVRRRASPPGRGGSATWTEPRRPDPRPPPPTVDRPGRVGLRPRPRPRARRPRGRLRRSPRPWPAWPAPTSSRAATASTRHSSLPLPSTRPSPSTSSTSAAPWPSAGSDRSRSRRGAWICCRKTCGSRSGPTVRIRRRCC